jgi:hypothetical protein
MNMPSMLPLPNMQMMPGMPGMTSNNTGNINTPKDLYYPPPHYNYSPFNPYPPHMMRQYMYP